MSGVSADKVEAMFPTAAATSKMLKSGMTLTQIYNEYVQATDALQLEKEENKRLNTYLDQILQVGYMDAEYWRLWSLKFKFSIKKDWGLRELYVTLPSPV